MKGRESNSAPIEVWLRQANMAVTCTIVREDESTIAGDIASLSMRGAEREITGYLIGHGWAPVSRWQDENVGEDRDRHTEVSRRFKPGKDAEPI